MIRICAFITLALSSPLLGAAAPAPIIATCATLLSVLSPTLPGGSIIALTNSAHAPAPCPPIVIKGRNYSPSVTIIATGMTLTRVDVDGSSGIAWHGGDFDGKNEVTSGFSVGESAFVTIEGATMHNYLRNSIIYANSSDFRVTGNIMSHSGSDGIDIALSRRGLIDGNTCSDPDTTTGSHPDCVQLWSRPTAAPVADITISNNSATGAMQGFNGFNHVRGGINDGGFDRIVVINNTAATLLANGIYFTDCRACVFRHNHLITPKGAAHSTHFVISGASSGSISVADQTFHDKR
ncbi:right-handed parallel beta-helix repeat-containing protein (plasmid) [Polymorphobacter sp. PAMC 29334]|uniref:right-handed parallel beta-helix repeat-containing protein n=1 Tax=Polymorphobacter sp. PAMC 29334 TaxID=2862331 RepID=UPI001C751A19|nr:right-handed parallel beta-helix repeat-containing protein [Polymorphobacter sp. PAMC 29334]QYE33195.1 right-handed parallel beta-helix repeat-containing protein [Polymorphobacter sp. PAMC 29334]